MLAEQVEQRRLQRGDGVDRHAQVERLQAAPAGIAIGECGARLLQDAQIVADWSTDDQRARIFDGGADRLASRNLPDPAAAGAVGEDGDVAREERAVRAAEIQQHAVAPGHGDDSKIGNYRGATGHACSPMFRAMPFVSPVQASRRGSCRSVGSDLSGLDHLFPTRRFPCLEFGELRRRVGDDLETLGAELLLDLLFAER
jgi:hypothetical protein